MRRGAALLKLSVVVFSISLAGPNRAILIAVLPVATHIAKLYLSDRSRARILSYEAARVCRIAAKSGAVKPDLWENSATLFEQIFESAADWRELATRAEKFGDDGTSGLTNFCYLGVALGAGLVQSLKFQYAIMWFADSFYARCFRSIYATTFVPFIEMFWQRALDEFGFQFTMPMLTRKAIGSARELPFDQRIRPILSAVSRDLRVSPKPQIQSWLDSIPTG